MARKKMKLKDAIQGYMLRCQSKGLSLRTQEWYEQKLTCFCEYLHSRFAHLVDQKGESSASWL
jgi:hypothetical protein